MDVKKTLQSFMFLSYQAEFNINVYEAEYQPYIFKNAVHSCSYFDILFSKNTHAQERYF